MEGTARNIDVHFLNAWRVEGDASIGPEQKCPLGVPLYGHFWWAVGLIAAELLALLLYSD
jgi:hypothetical protein